MFAQVFGTCTFGLNGHVITVEVDISRASPAFDIVGLPAVSVKESKERVQSAIRNSGYFFPIEKVTVNLAPADLKKDGSCLDLPIAMGVLGGKRGDSEGGSCIGDVYRRAFFAGGNTLGARCAFHGSCRAGSGDLYFFYEPRGCRRGSSL